MSIIGIGWVFVSHMTHQHYKTVRYTFNSNSKILNRKYLGENKNVFVINIEMTSLPCTKAFADLSVVYCCVSSLHVYRLQNFGCSPRTSHHVIPR